MESKLVSVRLRGDDAQRWDALVAYLANATQEGVRVSDSDTLRWLIALAHRNLIGAGATTGGTDDEQEQEQ